MEHLDVIFANRFLEERAAKIRELDQTVLKLGKKIHNPGYFLRFVLLLIRLGEIRSIRRIIQILELSSKNPAYSEPHRYSR